jgi:type III secretion protein C
MPFSKSVDPCPRATLAARASTHRICRHSRGLRAAAGVLALAWGFCAGPGAHATTPATWKEASTYTYRAERTPVNKMLADFARTFGASLVGGVPASAVASGRFSADSPEQYLDRLASEYRFSWFFFNNQLYIAPLADRVSERLDVGEMTGADVKQALIGLGLFEAKFGWGELQEEGAVLVAGPREYVNQVRTAISKDLDSDEARTMTFKVRHGFVEDREIGFRGSKMVVPGLVTILRNLAKDVRAESPLSNGSMPPSAVTRPAVGPALNSNLVPPARALEARINPTERLRAMRRDQPALIEGDIRTNMLIVRDLPRKREYYLSLLRELDVPLRLIEIEAVIIDVERKRLKELGIDWAGTFGGGQSRSNFSVSPSGQGLGPAGLVASPSTLLLSNLGGFMTQIRALEGEGQASIVAKPAIMTMDNLAAVIDMSETRYIKLVGERTASVEAVTAGTMLKVTPKIITDGAETVVRLMIDIEDGKLLDNGTGETPSVSRSTVATQTEVQNQQSLVIGGLQVQTDNTGQRGVPGLAKLPFIGAVFRGSNRGASTRDRLFLITPRIIDRPIEQARAAAIAEHFASNKAPLPVNSASSAASGGDSVGAGERVVQPVVLREPLVRPPLPSPVRVVPLPSAERNGLAEVASPEKNPKRKKKRRRAVSEEPV